MTSTLLPEPQTASTDVSGDVLAEQRFLDHVTTHLPRNARAYLIHGMLGMTGFRLLTAPTFVPAYLFLLSGSRFTVGLVLSAQYAGMAASSIWGATLIEHRQRVMPMIYLVGWLVRGQILGLGLSALLLSGTSALAAATVFLSLFGLLNGVQNVTFNYLTSKIIPLSRRGRLTALRNFFGGLTAAVVAWLGGRYLVGYDVFGNGYAATFLSAFALTSLGISALAGMREPALHDVRPQAGFLRRVRELPALLAADRDFVRFFVARALVAFGMMAMPFYAIYAGLLVGLDGSTLGFLSLAYLLAQTGSNLLWGRIADRHGYRLVFLASIGTWVVATGWLLACTTLPGFLLAFGGLGAGFGGFFISADNLVMEFGSRKDRPMLLAISDTATYSMMAIGPIVGGLLAQSVHFSLVFVAAIVVKAFAFTLALGVADPRQRRAGEGHPAVLRTTPRYRRRRSRPSRETGEREIRGQVPAPSGRSHPESTSEFQATAQDPVAAASAQTTATPAPTPTTNPGGQTRPAALQSGSGSIPAAPQHPRTAAPEKSKINARICRSGKTVLSWVTFFSRKRK